MKKSDSRQDKEALHEELKRLRKENRKLVSQKEKLKTKYDKAKKDPHSTDVFPFGSFFTKLCHKN